MFFISLKQVRPSQVGQYRKIIFSSIHKSIAQFPRKQVRPSQGIDTVMSYSHQFTILQDFTCGPSPGEPTTVHLHQLGEQGGHVTLASLDQHQ
jgi:hypothetical protein